MLSVILTTIGVPLLFFLHKSSGSGPVNLTRLNTCCALRNDFNGGLGICGEHKNVLADPNDDPTLEIPAHLMTNHLGQRFGLHRPEPGQTLKCASVMKKYTSPYHENPVAPIFEFQSDGFLQVGNDIFGQIYSPNQYCVNGLNDSDLEVVVCTSTRESCTPKTPCIQKCCSLEKFFNLTTGQCETYHSDTSKWSPIMYEKPGDKSTEMILESKPVISPWWLLRAPGNARGRTGWRKHCNARRTLMLNYEDPDPLTSWHGTPFRIRQDGQIFYWNSLKREWEQHTSNYYCVDGAFTGGTNGSLVQAWFSCPKEPNKEREASTYFGTLCILSSLFSLATVAAYIVLWDKQTIHGWTIMSHAIAISLFFILLGFAHLTRELSLIMNSPECAVIATLAHFFFISTFSWVTLISFDLWVTFRVMSVSKSKHVKRFVAYCAFGWGIPLLVVCTAWILQLSYGDEEFSTVKVPMYGQMTCYISSYSIVEYAYYPCGILLGLNLTFFAMTTIHLYEYKKSTRFATQNMQSNRQSSILFVKLFFVVGVLWVIEFINRYFVGTNVTWYVQILDTFNCLQPVAIFVIFVCKEDVVKSLIERKPCLRPLLTPILKILTLCNGQKSESEESGMSTGSRLNDTTMSKLSVSTDEEEDAV